MDVPEHSTRHEADHAHERRDLVVPRSRRLSGKTQIALLVVLAALLAGGLALSGVFSAQDTPQSADAPVPATQPDNAFKPTPRQWAGFAIASVQDKTFQPVQETDGKIAYDDDLTTPVFSPFTGRVSNVFVRMGDQVVKNQPLVAVQATEFVQAQNDLITAAAALKTARAQLNLAQTNEKRQHALYLAQGGALKDWQQSQVDLAVADGALHGAEISLGAVRNRLRILGRTDPQIEAMQDDLEALSFSPEALILSPVDGVVTQRQVGVGQNVVSQSNGGSTALFSIGDLSKVWLLGNVREDDAPLIRIGETVGVSVPAYRGRLFEGRVSYVAPSIDPVTHRLAVHAEVENPDRALKPEMLASFRIITGKAVTSPSVPESALVYEGDKVHVWVADDGSKTIALREVTIGRIAGGQAQILDGLRQGEKVVTAGSLFLDRAASGD